MGVGGSASKPLAKLFGADEENTRGPTLGAALLPSPEAGNWRLTLAAPLRIQVFDAHTAKPVVLEDTSAATAIQDHAPFTAFSSSEPATESGARGAGGGAAGGSDACRPTYFAVGCQDGTVLVFSLSKGTVSGPLYELRVAGDQLDGANSPTVGGSASEGVGTSMSITVLHLHCGEELYAGLSGRCCYWDLGSGELRREFHLPGSSQHPATPTTLAAVSSRAGDSNDRAAAVSHLWVGLDNGNIVAFDVQSGVLVRSFSCTGPEAVMSLAYFRNDAVIFALSAYRRVSVWDAGTYACLQKYPADLMTCGADLTAMVAVDLKSIERSLLLLAGVDGSLCVRRVSRRPDGKLNCVLLCYMENISGDAGCPITSIDYHAATDTVLVGDAGCRVALLANFREQLGTAVQAHGEGPATTQRLALAPAAGVAEALPPAAAAPIPAAASPAATPAGRPGGGVGGPPGGGGLSPQDHVEPPLPPPEEPPTSTVQSVTPESPKEGFPVFRGD